MRNLLLLKRFAIASKNENNKEIMDINERKYFARKYAVNTKAAPAKKYLYFKKCGLGKLAYPEALYLIVSRELLMKCKFAC